MVRDILALLQLFKDRVPDRETHGWVEALAADQSKWPNAHRVFSQVRGRTLSAITAKDAVRETQYMFEEICLKCLYNETATNAPFDSDSPHWIIKCAIHLARGLGIPVQQVIDVIAPGGGPEAESTS